MKRGVVALLTDFGTSDPYVGILKAVIAGIAPRAILIDLTHEVPPGDIPSAAFRLWQAAPYLPRGAAVLAVVDPGVGTSRRPLALAFDHLRCVGPDNGIFTYLLATRPCRQLVKIAPPPGGGNSTFHGRDIFAPAAARLATGVPLQRLGPPAQDPVRLALPRLSVSGSHVAGEVIAIDRFGNAITSIGALRAGETGLSLTPWLPGCPETWLEGSTFQVALATGERIFLARTFGDVPTGAPVAYVGSDHLLEVGINGGRAVDRLALAVGSRIELGPTAGESAGPPPSASSSPPRGG